jgi:hypothetical protein
VRLSEIALAWFAYFVLHSLFAASITKEWFSRRWPQLMPGYRAAFNAFSIVALIRSVAGVWNRVTGLAMDRHLGLADNGSR